MGRRWDGKGTEPWQNQGMGSLAASPSSPASAAVALWLRRALHQLHGQKRAQTKLEGVEAGFTLVELLVVLLIMAVLLAIAIPTFLGVRTSAQDRAIQSDLTNSLMSAKAEYAKAGSFAATPTLEVQLLASAEPNLIFDPATVEPAKGSNALSVDTSPDGQQVLLVGYSASGGCWAIEDNEGVAAAAVLANTMPYTSQGEYYATWPESTGSCDDAGLAASTPVWTPRGYPGTV
jgi:type IV pilus assembly protein PilA